MNDNLASKLRALSPEQLDKLKRAMADRPAPAAGMSRQPQSRSALSAAQLRLWLMSQVDGASSAYNIPGVFRVDGALDPALLRGALRTLQARHEILRTSFDVDQDKQPYQSIDATAAIDFNALPADGRSVDELAREVMLAPFDLRTGPLWRARLVTLGEREHVLIFSFHHIVFDGWSLGVFARELFALYGDGKGRHPGMPMPAHQ
ncbi:MAG: condensation domain-containing protein, partial [Massilia sp.]